MADLSTEKRASWHEPHHPLWSHFVEWSGRNVSPGGGHGHMVDWYWTIFKEGAYAESLHNLRREHD